MAVLTSSLFLDVLSKKQSQSTSILAILYFLLKIPVLSCFVRSFYQIYFCIWWPFGKIMCKLDNINFYNSVALMRNAFLASWLPVFLEIWNKSLHQSVESGNTPGIKQSFYMIWNRISNNCVPRLFITPTANWKQISLSSARWGLKPFFLKMIFLCPIRYEFGWDVKKMIVTSSVWLCRRFLKNVQLQT